MRKTGLSRDRRYQVGGVPALARSNVWRLASLDAPRRVRTSDLVFRRHARFQVSYGRWTGGPREQRGSRSRSGPVNELGF